MKRGILISASVILITLLLASTSKSLRIEAESQTGGALTEWEYLIVAGGHANLSTSGNDQYTRMRKAPDSGFSREQFPLSRNLDRLGAQGWELVAVQGSPADPVFYLKRPKQPGR